MVTAIIRFTDETKRLLETLRKTAKSNHRSLNGEMLRAFEFYLQEAPDAQYEVKPMEKEVVEKKSKSKPP